MGIALLLRVLLASLVAGIIGWVALAVLGLLKIVQIWDETSDANFETQVPKLWSNLEFFVINIQNGAILCAATIMACVPLSELLRSRSLLYYSGATAALSAGLASSSIHSIAFTPGATPTSPAILFALSGAVAGLAYWLMAAPSKAQE